MTIKSVRSGWHSANGEKKPTLIIRDKAIELGVKPFVGLFKSSDLFYREDVPGVEMWLKYGVIGAEMEGAALYTFAEAKERPVICFAHVTNRMATVENDFEKGEADGNKAMVDLAERTARTWRQTA